MLRRPFPVDTEQRDDMGRQQDTAMPELVDLRIAEFDERGLEFL